MKAGLRAGLPFAVAAFMLALSFGVVAQNLGMPGWAAILMSAVVFSGSAQFAAITIIAQGGGLGAGIVAAALVNSRFLPMGIALAPVAARRAGGAGGPGPGHRGRVLRAGE